MYPGAERWGSARGCLGRGRTAYVRSEARVARSGFGGWGESGGEKRGGGGGVGADKERRGSGASWGRTAKGGESDKIEGVA